MREATGTQVRDAARVLRAIRREGGTTRFALSNDLDLGRDALSQRLAGLVSSGLVLEGEAVVPTGGRSAREFTFNSKAGLVLAAAAGVSGYTAAVTDLEGNIFTSIRRDVPTAQGPDAVLGSIVETLLSLREEPSVPQAPTWGMGVSLPGPVDAARGIPVSPPPSPEWNRFPVRDYLETALGVPVWVENDVVLMTLGELRKGAGGRHGDMIFIKMGSGIGGGVVSGGRLHRGSNSAAGMIGHIKVTDDPSVFCICGNIGCLGSAAGGIGLAQKATDQALVGASGFLADRLKSAGTLSASDVLDGSEFGDPTSLRLLGEAGSLVGNTIAALVNFFNPSLVVLGGSIPARSDLVVSRIKEAIYSQSLPVNTSGLQIVPTSLGNLAGITGAAQLVVDELLETPVFRRWFGSGSPGVPELARVRDVRDSLVAV